MIRLLLILMLAQVYTPEPMTTKVWRPSEELKSFTLTAEIVTCQCWRCICTGPDGRCWTGCCNASRAARLVLNIHGMDELPDIDAWIDTPITWRYHTWCWPHALPGGWRCFSMWITDWIDWKEAIWEGEKP